MGADAVLSLLLKSVVCRCNAAPLLSRTPRELYVREESHVLSGGTIGTLTNRCGGREVNQHRVSDCRKADVKDALPLVSGQYHSIRAFISVLRLLRLEGLFDSALLGFS